MKVKIEVLIDIEFFKSEEPKAVMQELADAAYTSIGEVIFHSGRDGKVDESTATSTVEISARSSMGDLSDAR